MPGTATTIELLLYIDEPELRAALEEHPWGRERNEFAEAALRIGALALRHARGQIDSTRARAAGDRLAADVGRALEDHQRAIVHEISTCLRAHFDPDGDAAELTTTLTGYVGRASADLRRSLSASVEREIALLRERDDERETNRAGPGGE